MRRWPTATPCHENSLNPKTLHSHAHRSLTPYWSSFPAQKVLLRQSDQLHNPNSLLSRGRQLQAPRGAQQGDAIGLKHVLYSR
jgi:hypothetical protein